MEVGAEAFDDWSLWAVPHAEWDVVGEPVLYK